jgi:hypothetical protein
MSREEEERRRAPIFNIPDVSNIDANRLSRRYKDAEPDFLPHNKSGRDPSAHLMVFTGAMWVGGYFTGGLYGLREGWRNASSSSAKVRVNSVLNAVSKNGSKVANVAGVLAFMHTGFNWLGHFTEAEKVTGSEWTVPIVSGVMTGGIYKSTAAPRVAILSAALGGVASCIYSFGGGYVSDAIFGRKGRY